MVKRVGKYSSDGRLVKSVVSSNGGKATCTYAYKAVTVPSSLAKKVKAQQWAALNGDLNYALGTGAGTLFPCL